MKKIKIRIERCLVCNKEIPIIKNTQVCSWHCKYIMDKFFMLIRDMRNRYQNVRYQVKQLGLVIN